MRGQERSLLRLLVRGYRLSFGEHETALAPVLVRRVASGCLALLSLTVTTDVLKVALFDFHTELLVDPVHVLRGAAYMGIIACRR